MSVTSGQPGRIRPPGPDQKLKLSHVLQYGCVLGLALFARFAPLFVARGLGSALGRLVHALDKKHRKIALLNLDTAFGDTKTEEQKRAITANCFRHFGRALMETLACPKVNSANFLRFVQLENLGGFYDGLKGGNGVILCSAHYGNWEIMNLSLGFLNLPLSAMARPVDNPLVHRLVERIRTRSGNRVIYKHRAVRRLLTTLKENRIVGIVNDQDVHNNNRIMLEFFGRAAATTPLPAALAYRTGAPIITGYAVPLGKGRYLLKYGDLIYADPDAGKDEEIRRITAILNRRLEAQIHFHPDYWLWMHKRFKTDAEGRNAPFYDRDRAV